jgi:hypothetical protein
MAGSSPRQYQENTGHEPLQEAEEPPQIQMGTAPNEAAPDLSLPERLRRLAERYVNDQDSIVSGVHLESGPSGRSRVVITIETGNVLGDAIH